MTMKWCGGVFWCDGTVTHLNIAGDSETLYAYQNSQNCTLKRVNLLLEWFIFKSRIKRN